MLLCDPQMPSYDVMKADLESRGVEFAKWSELAKHNPHLLRKLQQCYTQHNWRRRFDAELHQYGLRLRLNFYCAWVLQEYPEMQHFTCCANPQEASQ